MINLKHSNIFKLLLINFVIFLGLMPLQSEAHGGVQKSTGNIVVYISQSPISPLVGEKVKFTFVIKRKDELQGLQNFRVNLTMIDTFYGDETKDKIILSTEKKTDANGAFQFDYVFNKENYFDIDLAFKDPITGEQENTGFLIQPRNIPGYPPEKFAFTELFAGIFLGLTMGIAIVTYIYSRSRNVTLTNS